jgi:signal transduction histidine kinase
VALGLVGVLFVCFAAMAPFAATPLLRFDSFYPTVDAIVFVTDLTTAVLLFNQFAIVRASELLILASGYLFSGLIVISHALTFPGAFTPTGLLGAGIQSTPWLFTFWHFGFSAAVLCYACLKDRSRAESANQHSAAPAIYRSAIIVVSLVCALTLAVTAGEEFLPRLFLSEVQFAPLANYVTVATFLTSALVLVLLWIRGRSALDLWVMVAIAATVIEQATTAFLISSRYSVGFYASAAFSVIVSTIVLLALLTEIVIVYAKLSYAIRKLQRERETKLINLGAAIAVISHEIKQPLTAITMKGSAARRFLERPHPDISRSGAILDEIVQLGFRANEVLESMSALFRGGDQELQPIDLNDMIGETLRLSHEDLVRHGITVRIHLSPGLPPIAGNKAQLQEVILNLIQNAIDAMNVAKDGARILRVKTERYDPQTIAISVNDSGPGIDPQIIAHVFDAFVTTKAKGKGLGLAISHMIIELHGGQISVRSSDLGGAQFEITLPIRAYPVPAAV